jgi:hypothetical protein
MLGYSPYGDMSNAATIAVMKRDVSLLMEKMNFFQISSKTPRVYTAMVAVSDASPCGCATSS